MNRALPTDTAPLSTDTYSYTAGTNRLASVRTGTGAAAPTRTIQYDARGNTAAETRSNGPAGAVSVTTAYDGYGRLTQYTRGTETLSFQYNGRDDRVAMTSASVGVRRYVYDPAGRVIGEYGFSAADVKAEFIWLSPEVANDNAFGGDDGIGGYAPLAVATPDSSGTVQLNWVHPNHLGVPLVTTDASGNPATTPGDYLAPGFPGQARVLADLYYNRYRDYDPTTGRYIQADPIGLAGGGNPYLYAGGNPMGRVDPLGLDILNLFPYEQPEFRGAAARQYWNLSPDIRNSMVHIFGHANSNPTIFCVRATTGPMCLGPDKFLDWLIAQNIDLHKPVMLWGCQAGRNGIGGTDSFAQQLSRLMKVKGYAGVVVGATENTRWDLGFLGTGTFTHRGYIGMRGNGRWRTFVGGNEQ